MRFAQPSYAHLFWLVLAMGLLYWYSFKRKEKALRLFASAKMLQEVLIKDPAHKPRARALMLLLSMVFLCFSLMRPLWGYSWEEVRRQGVDIVVAIDTSLSMLAEDVPSSRLERAKRELVDLVAMLEGDRIGLVAFAGRAFLHCPLTLDYGACLMFLDLVDTDLIPIKGTNIADAIYTSLEAFDSDSNSKAIILITDGEDHSGQALKAALEAKRQGVKIFCLGIGKDVAPIRLKGSSGLKKDPVTGELVLTKFDESTLQKIALETDGIYVRSVTGDMDLKRIYQKEIRGKLERMELQSTRQRKAVERFQIPLFFAFVALFMESLMGYRKHG